MLWMLSHTVFAGLPYPESDGATLQVSGPLEGPQPSTSSGVGDIQPSSAGVAGSAGASGFDNAVSSALDENIFVQIIYVTDDYMQWWPLRLGSSLSSTGNPTVDSSEHGRAGDGAAGAGAGCTKHVPGTSTIS
ncbi:hypothetical protein O3P69_012778 [Scylla paramamosain]